MLCVDLTEEGTVITGNRTKTTAAADSAEPVEATIDEVSLEESDDDPYRPWPTPPPGNRNNSRLWSRKLKCTSKTTSTVAAQKTPSSPASTARTTSGPSTTNAEKLREALPPYAETGLKATRSGGLRSTRSRAAGSDPDTAKMRA